MRHKTYDVDINNTLKRAAPRPVAYPTRQPSERATLVSVAQKGQGAWKTKDSLQELAQLTATAGATVLEVVVQVRESPHVATYLGKGKLEELAGLKGETDYDLVICDDELSPTQQQNLERALGVKVIDRTALILDIFARHARTQEGRLQVELAQAKYLMPRLAGQWSHLERLGGGIGTRGPGETQLETDRRLVRRRIQRLERELEEVRRHRALHRQHRARQGLKLVALVGYTNAGKSTLFNALSHAQATVADKLFTTLDPTTRRLILPGGPGALLSDTVGFIQKLPPALVAAFRATLEELERADLLLHVLDISHPNAAAQAGTVELVLEELGLGMKPRVLALNKADLLLGQGSWEHLEPFSAFLEDSGHGAALVSATRGWGLEPLKASIAGGLALPASDEKLRISPEPATSLVKSLQALLLTDKA
ncbi:MAG: GTPase HflX [Chloroflexi bacterium]|nr:GTPase HflX [Chloroflexota bacterium]